MVSSPSDAHEWVSFEDPDEDRTWVFDVTFLMSSWTCIFGNGCQGVLTGPAAEMEQGCCSYGAHFTDDEDAARVTAMAATLTAEDWQFIDRGRNKDGSLRIIKENKEGETVTRQADDACIFLNRPEFAGGSGCALHRAALRRGTRPLDAKPNVCWQLPLRREDEDREDGHVVSTLRQWDRRHWGAGGDEFHWWCTESPDAFVGTKHVYQELADEIAEMVGRPVYKRLVAYLESKPAASFAPHPAVKVTLKKRANR
jgi:hypothetical protein